MHVWGPGCWTRSGSLCLLIQTSVGLHAKANKRDNCNREGELQTIAGRQWSRGSGKREGAVVEEHTDHESTESGDTEFVKWHPALNIRSFSCEKLRTVAVHDQIISLCCFHPKNVHSSKQKIRSKINFNQKQTAPASILESKGQKTKMTMFTSCR